MMTKRILIYSAMLCVLALVSWAPTSQAFPTYSKEDATGNCKSCHGDFLNSMYISRTDGANWGNLHNLHRNVMLAGPGYPTRCKTCHFVLSPGGPQTPVYLGMSDGNAALGMDPISCVGCHGRYEDYRPSGNDPTHGMGAGLRQHHTRSGITRCVDCHTSAKPGHFTPAPENALPPYYNSVNTSVFVNLPTDSCSLLLEEDFAGIAFGLDNDGDGKYDFADRDCLPASTKFEVCHKTDNPDKPVVNISVNGDALEAHLLHGDQLGGCD